MKVTRKHPALTDNSDPTSTSREGKGGTDIVDRIGIFIQEGEAMQARFMSSNDANMIKEEQFTWSQKVESYLSKNVGKAQATQFHITDANPWEGQPSGHSEAGGFHWAKIVARNRLLAQYMVEAQQRRTGP